tara:strand:- start:988 stop:2253 length:1266 start_codon:yes stop_codon:yes gene_type:complete
MTYIALSTPALSQLDYHWLWGLRRVPHGQNNLPEAVQLLRDNLDTQEIIALQMQAIWRLPWLIRALYWLFNINNYCLHYNLLCCCIALELYEATLSLTQHNPIRGHDMREFLTDMNKDVLLVGGFSLAGLAAWAMLKHYGCEPFIAEHLESFSKSISSVFFDTEIHDLTGERRPLLAMAETCAENIAHYEALISSAEDISVTEAMLSHLYVLSLTNEVGESLSLRDIEQAYKKEAKRTHPDKPGGNDDDFIAVKDAHDELIKMISHAEGSELTLYKSMLAYEQRLASVVTGYQTLERGIQAYHQKVDVHVARVDTHVARVDTHVARVDAHVARVDAHIEQVDEVKAIGERVKALLAARFERTKLKQKEHYEQESNEFASRMEEGTLNLSSHRYSLHTSFSTDSLREHISADSSIPKRSGSF